MNYNVRYVYGKPGTTGDKGEKGSIGEKSEIGLKGVIGNHGIKGILGDKGIIGIKGEIGEEGIVGKSSYDVNSFKGEKGEKGTNSFKIISLHDDNDFIQLEYLDCFEELYIKKKKIKGLKGIEGNDGIKGYSYHDIYDKIKGDKGTEGLNGFSNYDLLDLHIFKNSKYLFVREIMTGFTNFSKVKYSNTSDILTYNPSFKYGFTLPINQAVRYVLNPFTSIEFYLPNFYELNISPKFNKYHFTDNQNCIDSSIIFESNKDKVIYKNPIFNYDLTNLSRYKLFMENPFIKLEDVLYYTHIKNNIYNKYLFEMYPNTLSINVQYILPNCDNGFCITDKVYRLSGNKFPELSNNIYGYCNIGELRYYIPINMYIRLEIHLFKYENMINNLLLEYTDWIIINKNGVYDCKNFLWHQYREKKINDKCTLNVKYMFCLPYNLKLSNITSEVIYDNEDELVDYFGINDINYNKKENFNKYNYLTNDIKRKIYLPQILSTQIDIVDFNIDIS